MTLSARSAAAFLAAAAFTTPLSAQTPPPARSAIAEAAINEATRLEQPWMTEQSDLLRLGKTAVAAIAAVKLTAPSYERLKTDAGFTAVDIVEWALYAKTEMSPKMDTNSFADPKTTVAETRKALRYTAGITAEREGVAWLKAYPDLLDLGPRAVRSIAIAKLDEPTYTLMRTKGDFTARDIVTVADYVMLTEHKDGKRLGKTTVDVNLLGKTKAERTKLRDVNLEQMRATLGVAKYAAGVVETQKIATADRDSKCSDQLVELIKDPAMKDKGRELLAQRGQTVPWYGHCRLVKALTQ